MSKQQTIRTTNPTAVEPKAPERTETEVDAATKPIGYGVALMELLMQQAQGDQQER